MATRKPSEVSTVRPHAPNLPAYLADVVDNSLDALKEHRVLPRLKVIQAMSAEELKDNFGEGTAILRPGDAVVAKKNADPIQVVPIGFFVEYCKWSDRNDKESNAIVDRSFDPTSEVAMRCKDTNKRFEIYPGQEQKKEPQQFRYVEHQNFVCMVYGNHGLSGEPFVLDFSKGEFNTGKSFLNSILMRKVPLWAQVWSLSTSLRDKGTRKWYGADLKIPAEGEGQFVTEAEAPVFQGLYSEFRELIAKRRIIVDGADHDLDTETGAGATGETKF